MELTKEGKEAIERATAEDTALFDQLAAKIGRPPAVILSEIANLVALTRVHPSTESSVDGLIGAVLECLKLDKEEALAYIREAIIIRTVRIHAPGCQHSKKPH